MMIIVTGMAREQMYGFQETLWEDLRSRVDHPDAVEIEYELIMDMTPLRSLMPQRMQGCLCGLCPDMA